MLLNLSNHPSPTWPKNQKQTAIEKYGEIHDLAFPKINPEWTHKKVQLLAEEYAHKVRKINPSVVHVMGEMTFTYALVVLLKKAGIPCVASTTERVVTDDKMGNKTSQFRFSRFRRY